MLIKLGGQLWEIDDDLPEQEQIDLVRQIRIDLWKKGIDPDVETDEEREEFLRGQRERFDAEEDTED
jgi:hypothetical protein